MAIATVATIDITLGQVARSRVTALVEYLTEQNSNMGKHFIHIVEVDSDWVNIATTADFKVIVSELPPTSNGVLGHWLTAFYREVHALLDNPSNLTIRCNVYFNELIPAFEYSGRGSPPDRPWVDPWDIIEPFHVKAADFKDRRFPTGG